MTPCPTCQRPTIAADMVGHLYIYGQALGLALKILPSW